MTSVERSGWELVGKDIKVDDELGSPVAWCVHRTCRIEDGIPGVMPL